MGERGTLEAIRQMQGFEAPQTHGTPNSAAPNRGFRSQSARPALPHGRRWVGPPVAASSNARSGHGRKTPRDTYQRRSITFFVREDADWMIPRRESVDVQPAGLSADAGTVLQFLRQRGASFFADIVRGTGKLKAEVETALWNLWPLDSLPRMVLTICVRLSTLSGAPARAADEPHDRGTALALVTAVFRRPARPHSSARSDLLDAFTSLRNRVPRASHPRNHSSKWREVLITLVASKIAANSRRPVCQWIFG